MLQVSSFYIKHHNIYEETISIDIIDDHFDIIMNDKKLKNNILLYLKQICFAIPNKKFIFKYANLDNIFPFIVIIMFYEALYDIHNKIYIYGDLRQKIIGTFAASILSINDTLITTEKEEASLIERQNIKSFSIDSISDYYAPMENNFDTNHKPVEIPRALLIALTGNHSIVFQDAQYLKENIQNILCSLFYTIPLTDQINFTFYMSLRQNVTKLIKEYLIFFEDNIDLPNNAYLISDNKPKNNMKFIATQYYDDMTIYSKDLDFVTKYNIHYALKAQTERYNEFGIKSNDEITLDNMLHINIGLNHTDALHQIHTQFKLSEQEYLNVIKVARTIADINQSNLILKEHIIESSILCIINKRNSK